MFQRMLASGLIAGFAAGLFAAMLHFAFVQKFILLGEDYETGALIHYQGVAAGAAADGHAHSHDPAPLNTAQGGADPGAEGDGHSHADSTAPSVLQRNGLTVLFTALIYAAYGLMMAAGFGLAERFGHRVAAQSGLLWGIAGFATFALAPAMGLPPELPGTPAADLAARQVWWLGTVAATGAGLGLLAFGRGAVVWLVAAVLLAAPHVIGAPQPGSFAGVAPPEVAGQFSARVLGVGLMAWAALGTLTARMWARAA